MITPEQMLQEAIQRIGALSVDEFETMLREAGLDLVRKESEDYSSLANDEMVEVEWVESTMQLNHNSLINGGLLDTNEFSSSYSRTTSEKIV
jgi:hypothetical protein